MVAGSDRKNRVDRELGLGQPTGNKPPGLLSTVCLSGKDSRPLSVYCVSRTTSIRRDNGTRAEGVVEIALRRMGVMNGGIRVGVWVIKKCTGVHGTEKVYMVQTRGFRMYRYA